MNPKVESDEKRAEREEEKYLEKGFRPPTVVCSKNGKRWVLFWWRRRPEEGRLFCCGEA
jgi:hypothetical protein